MKMFLTRLGFGSKIVITGDVTQIDLPDGKASGLKRGHAGSESVEGIGICGADQCRRGAPCDGPADCRGL